MVRRVRDSFNSSYRFTTDAPNLESPKLISERPPVGRDSLLSVFGFCVFFMLFLFCSWSFRVLIVIVRCSSLCGCCCVFVEGVCGVGWFVGDCVRCGEAVGTQGTFGRVVKAIG